VVVGTRVVVVVGVVVDTVIGVVVRVSVEVKVRVVDDDAVHPTDMVINMRTKLRSRTLIIRLVTSIVFLCTRLPRVHRNLFIGYDRRKKRRVVIVDQLN
jgi:hypothetical protein